MSRLIIVSNRVPDVNGPRAGGLAVALRAVLENNGGLWFGWNGKTLDETDTTPVISEFGTFQLATIGLSHEDVNEYYHGAGNQVLWPLFHNRLDLMRARSRYYDAYRRVNQRFAHCLIELLQPDDLVWVQDFHLIPLGAQLRSLGFGGRIGFFLHIPFPPVDLLKALPWAAELVRWLGKYDIVAFQAKRDAHNLHEFIIRIMGGSASDGECLLEGRPFRCGIYPVSIDTAGWLNMVRSERFIRDVEKIRAEIDPPVFSAIGVERLDYSKGLLQRLLAFEQLLVQEERFRGDACLYQVVAPSRSDVPEYARLRKRLDAVSGRINGSYARFSWAPIRYLHRTYSQGELAALYRICPVGIVSSLIDGMNLVAKEFVVCQDPEDPGALVLSMFTGAAETFGNAALLVNPYDIENMAERISDAFDMSPGDRRQRWEEMMHDLEVHDIHYWANSFIHDLQDVPLGGA